MGVDLGRSRLVQCPVQSRTIPATALSSRVLTISKDGASTCQIPSSEDASCVCVCAHTRTHTHTYIVWVMEGETVLFTLLCRDQTAQWHRTEYFLVSDRSGSGAGQRRTETETKLIHREAVGRDPRHFFNGHSHIYRVLRSHRGRLAFDPVCTNLSFPMVERYRRARFGGEQSPLPGVPLPKQQRGPRGHPMNAPLSRHGAPTTLGVDVGPGSPPPSATRARGNSSLGQRAPRGPRTCPQREGPGPALTCAADFHSWSWGGLPRAAGAGSRLSRRRRVRPAGRGARLGDGGRQPALSRARRRERRAGA